MNFLFYCKSIFLWGEFMRSIYLFEIFLIFVLFIFINGKIGKDETYNLMDKYHTDMMKGIAIMLVIISHLGGILGVRYFTPLGGIGVSIFLICSGYGLSKSYISKGLSGYWENRILRVVIPYYIIGFLYIVFTLNFDLRDILLSMFFIKPMQPYGWFMSYIISMYLIFYIVQSAKISQKIRDSIYFLIACIILFAMPDIEAEQSFSFFIGVFYAFYTMNFKEKISDKKISLKLGLVFIFLSIFALSLKQLYFIRNAYPVIFNTIQLIIKLCGALGLILIVYSLQRYISKFNFSLFSTLSFELYLVHGYTIKVLENLNYLNIIIFFVLTIIFAIMLKLIDNFIIELPKKSDVST